MENKTQHVEYIFAKSKRDTDGNSKRNNSFFYVLAGVQIIFILSFWIYVQHIDYNDYKNEYHDQTKNLYSMFMDVHSMMFIGFGFLMTFLKRYGFSSIGYNFLISCFVLEWAILVRGWISFGFLTPGIIKLNIENLLVADFCAAAVLISFGAVIGKATIGQLIIMALFEVVFQGINEHIGLDYLKAYDVGESIYVHVFGAFFGLAVAKVLHHKRIENDYESSNYHSDLFSMIGTLFLWLYWPSFNSAVAVEEGQIRAIVNTYISISASCITTFIVSSMVGKGKLNMVHIQNATLAGGVAIGAIADMAIPPHVAMAIGSVAGVISTLGFEFLTDKLKEFKLHDTCGVNNLHGIPGVISGLCSVIVAAVACREDYGENRLYTFYPSRVPLQNSTEYLKFELQNTEFKDGGLGRTALEQSGYQFAALAMTLVVSILTGLLTGFIMKFPFFAKIKDPENMFDDEFYYKVPEEYSMELKGLRKVEIVE